MTDKLPGLRADPAAGLSGAQEMRLWQADVLAEDGVLRIAPPTTPERLAGARMLTNARVLLRALADGPVTATQSLGNLPRSFVRRMLKEMSWKPEQLERFGLRDRAFANENEVPDLEELRAVLGVAGLLKKRHGRFSLTQRGARMVAEKQAGRLFALLLRTYFGKFNVFYGFRWQDDPEMQERIVFSLWVIREIVGGGETADGGGTAAARPAGATTREIAHLVARDELLWGMIEAQQAGWGARHFPDVVAAVILEPLEALGLLTQVPSEGSGPFGLVRDWDLETRWAATPLFRTALTFELGPAEPDGAAEDEAEWAAFVPAEHVTAGAAFERYLADDASLLVHDVGPDIHLLASAWWAFLDGTAAAPRGKRSGKAKAASRKRFSALQAVALAPAFVASVRASEHPDEPGPSMFAATMAADFAWWCAEYELIPQSMAMRRAEEAQQAAWRLSRDMRDVMARDDGVIFGADPENVLAPPARTPPARTPPPASGGAGHAQLRLVPDTRAAESDAGRIARLSVTLMETAPPVWRRVEVPAGSTFAQLHTFLNVAMGWEDYHLHELAFGDRRVGAAELNDGNGPAVEDEQELTLADALADGHRELIYIYDFGDEWLHRVQVDAVEDAAEGVFYPRCTGGARACPPEDVGGAYGYALFLEALADARHPEHEEQTLWCEEVYGSDTFDADAFDAAAVSRLLRIAATTRLTVEDFFGAE